MKPELPLTTDRLLLRPYTPDDVEAALSFLGRADVARYSFWDPLSREQVADRLDRLAQKDGDWPEGEGIFLALIDKASGTLIGDAGLNFRDREARQAEVGYTVHPGWQGKGYATEAAAAFLDLAFGFYDLHRVYARCDVRNTGSWRVMEKLGMRREAHFKEHALFKGEWDEEFYYAMLQREWRTQGGKN